MVDLSRRQLLAGGALVSAAVMLPGCVTPHSPARNIPPGIQLWTVKEDMAKNPEATLKALADIGYKRVETAGWYNRTPAQYRKMLQDAGLDAVSAHFGLGDLIKDTDARLAIARDVGVQYVIASSPAPRVALDPKLPWSEGVAQAMTLADWRSNAEEMNRIGARARQMGMRFGYHNHSAELIDYEGQMPLAEIARITDPANVVLELDIGWVAGGGYDPVEIINRFAPRIHLLHIKDLATSERVRGKMVKDERTTVIGEGTLDWPGIFAATRKAPIHSYFVEQEEPFTEPALQAVAKSLAYLRSINV